MKIRKSRVGSEDTIEIQMTPMIDIVFQLLVFFIMTFKIVSMEGDFNIKMPASAREGPISEDTIPPIKIRLTAGPDGSISGIQMNGIAKSSWDEVQNEIITIVEGSPEIREDVEVELDCDYALHYEHVIEAITAVSGRINYPNRDIIRLVEKIKFSAPKKPPAGG
jgi:biopolymer transport protein ExbD